MYTNSVSFGIEFYGHLDFNKYKIKERYDLRKNINYLSDSFKVDECMVQKITPKFQSACR